VRRAREGGMLSGAGTPPEIVDLFGSGESEAVVVCEEVWLVMWFNVVVWSSTVE
jgi:hypothetical protein